MDENKEEVEEEKEEEMAVEPGGWWLWVLSWFGWLDGAPAEPRADSSSPQFLPGCHSGRLLVSLSYKARAVWPTVRYLSVL